MTRIAIAVLCLSAGVAHADSGTLPNGATISFGKLWLHENNVQAQTLPIAEPTSSLKYFNLAHCQCSQSGGLAADAAHSPWYEGSFAYQLLLNMQTTPIHAPLEVWVGSSCAVDPTTQQVTTNCHQIMSAGTSDLSTIVATNGINPEVPIYDLMEPEMGDTGCDQRVLSTAEWAISDVNPDGTIGSSPQYFVSQAISTDSLPPPAPTLFNAEGAENAIQVSWSAPIGDVADIAYYQALCADSNGNPVITSPPAPKYQTAATLCGASGFNITLTPVSVTSSTRQGPQAVLDGSVDAPADAPDAGTGDDDADAGVGTCTDFQGLNQLDPAYICGEVDDATATSMRITGLQNNVPYWVEIVAIDLSGNPAGACFTSQLTPLPVVDFWQDLHNKGSDVEGGFCLIAETYGDDNPLTQALRGFRDTTLGTTAYGRWLTDVYYGTLGKLGAIVHGHVTLRIVFGVLLLPLVALALLWHLLTLPGLLALFAMLVVIRRRKLRARLAGRAAAVVTLALIALAPTRAHAQTPYWEDPVNQGTTDTPVIDEYAVKWHMGIRVGPYTPAIDAQAASQGGATNSAGQGPYQAMFGGYAILPMLDVDRYLWQGFGQLGVGISVGYMGKSAHAFTEASDPNDPNRARSPGDTTSFGLIPLSVTAIYRLTYFDDEHGIPIVPYARAGLGYYIWWIEAPDGGFATINGSNKAVGASLGVVGSLGLSIRAERIDADAARSMRSSGIIHAGFYGEVSLAKVDGFGEATKLAVGDTTWFAGVDFEF